MVISPNCVGGVGYETERSYLKSIYRERQAASMTEAVPKALKDRRV